MDKHRLLNARSAGILLHPTSLPCAEKYWSGDKNAFGTLGREAYQFVDFMAAAKLTIWQLLPLGPTQDNLSPYQSFSVHAGNPELISLDNLQERGWLGSLELKLDDKSRNGLKNLRRECAKAFFHYLQQPQGKKTADDFGQFCQEHSYWLEDFAIFSTLHEQFNKTPWIEWPDEFRRRDPGALESIKKQSIDDINGYLFEQFAFATQWQALKHYANEKNIAIFGDMAIYVGFDSADVWAKPDNFKLDPEGQPLVVAGFPPDSFSESGQCWGNPIYAWDVMEKENFQWWLSRLHSQMNFFDLIRIDHFRGFETCWEIPANTKDARKGQWVKVPGEALLKACLEKYPDLTLVAENLGMQADEAEKLREKFNLPGMHVLHFAFESDSENSHLPHNHVRHNIVYTGTHDNNTTIGWFKGLNDAGKQQLINYSYGSSIGMPWLLIDMAFASPCHMAIIPMQDFLELDENHRMNIPATTDHNWQWKFSWDQVNPHLAQSIGDKVKKYYRCVQS